VKNKYYLGVVLVLLGGTFLSLSGILIRHIEVADGWQIMFYRSIAYFVTIGTVLVFQYRHKTTQKFFAVGWPGVYAAVILSIGSMFYIMALLNTTVANVVFIIGASPLIAALAGWLFLKEKITFASFVTMLLAAGGIGLMFADGYVSGGMIGSVFALLLVVSYVIYLLILRRNRHIDMLPATCLSGLVTAWFSLLVVDTLVINMNDLVICILLGSVQFGFGFMLLTWSTRYIPAAEVALFSLSESVLNPIWTWLGADETPSVITLTGSAIVLVSVITYSVMVIRRERASALH
jgi:drug/metabolite transporter (DMT)-like permease